ncbi:polysaccharide pyruvyl transferase family protein [Flavobacterium ginsenosidimutans]|uniref:Polysaccharide pyruvyl transferase family protein n=1 Tax=Flavobacterium ginsenosidimutans TaxID=687844 RepID=A0ABZ2Q8F1_9FLAO|nr:polysaccharide pyruvyl transferase family protein [Flavobacterium ginsenosidimutans]KAF2334160.1 polysaccharide pyruvyl transferase family protein [Flavobacterium ginsenosidimutans]
MDTIIKIEGAYGESNFGDDLLMNVFENFFVEEFPNSEIYFSGQEADYPEKILIKGLYNKKIKEDLLVYGGGTQFFSFSSENKKRSLFEVIKLSIVNPQFFFKKVKQKIFREKAYSKKTAFIGIGLGPFSDNKIYIDYTINKMISSNFIAVRDHISKKYCDDWKLNSVLGADVVFSKYFKQTFPSVSEKHKAKKKIGIIVRDWNWDESGNSYVDPLMEVERYSSKYEFEYIIFAPMKDKKWMQKLNGHNVVMWNPDIDSIQSFLEKLNDYSGFISARYHGAIIASLLNKPVVCIEIEDKLRILTEQVKEFKLWEKPFDKAQLNSHFDLFETEIDYSASLNALRESADNMFKNFKETFQNKYND